MEMIDRYVYAVCSKLPEKQREDIQRELYALIEDQVQENVGDRAITENDIKQVLLSLGDPAVLADEYRGTKRYLIGPELFNTYLTVLKVVGAAVFFALSLVLVLETAVSKDPISSIVRYLATLPGGILQSFAWVTLIFAILQYSGVKKKDIAFEKNAWTPENLPPVPDKKTQIPMAEPIAGIIFSVIFAVIFLASYELIGVIFFRDGAYVNIPVFNLNVFAGYLNYFYVLLALGILKESLKLFFRKWTPKLASLTLIISILSIGLVILIFSNPEIWNPSFMGEIAEAGLLKQGEKAYFVVEKIWFFISTRVVYVYLAAILVETITNFYKAFQAKLRLD